MFLAVFAIAFHKIGLKTHTNSTSQHRHISTAHPDRHFGETEQTPILQTFAPI
jgi:hypothetical protein